LEIKRLQSVIDEFKGLEAQNRRDWKSTIEMLNAKKLKSDNKRKAAIEKQEQMAREIYALRRVVDRIPEMVDKETQFDHFTEEASIQTDLVQEHRRGKKQKKSSEKESSKRGNVFSNYGSNSPTSKDQQSFNSFSKAVIVVEDESRNQEVAAGASEKLVVNKQVALKRRMTKFDHPKFGLNDDLNKALPSLRKVVNIEKSKQNTTTEGERRERTQQDRRTSLR
jgi:hypothetical protein